MKEIREKIRKRRDAIVGRESCSGEETATDEEMWWLLEQSAREGILLSYKDDPHTYHQGKEYYYHYCGISVFAEKEAVRLFVDTHPLADARSMWKLMKTIDTTDPEGQRVAYNIKRVRSAIIARERRHRKAEREEKKRQEEERREAEREARERREAEREEAARIAAEEAEQALRQEAYDHCNDITWLVDRIERLGWQVTLIRKEGHKGA